MNYLFSIVLLAAAAFAIAQEAEAPQPPVQAESTPGFKEKVRPLALKCKEEAAATDDDVSAVVNREELNSPAAKCLQKCVYTKIGAFKDDKITSYDDGLKIYKKLYENDEAKLEIAEKAVAECNKVAEENKGKDPCELASIVQACFRRF